MARSKKKPVSKARRWTKRVLTLTFLLLAAGMGYNCVSPMLAQGSETVYESFEVELGTVRTSMSLSGTISVGASETISNQSSTSFTNLLTVREIFVEQSQQVKKGDKLIQLSSGDVYRAGIDGTINEIRVSQGDSIRPNATLMDICDIENLKVSMSVDEYDIDKLSVGQKCTITVLPLGVSFDTTINHINRLTTGMGWLASYTVTADANAPDSVWPGMQATVTIAEDEAVDVPVLRMEAVSFDEEQNPCVLIKSAEGTYTQKAIEVGLSDGMYVEIKSGLSVGDVIWAATGVKETEPALSLTDLYKRVVGETVVINDRSGGGRAGRGGMDAAPEGMEMPKGMSTPGETDRMDFAQGEDRPGGMRTERQETEQGGVENEE